MNDFYKLDLICWMECRCLNILHLHLLTPISDHHHGLNFPLMLLLFLNPYFLHFLQCSSSPFSSFPLHPSISPSISSIPAGCLILLTELPPWYLRTARSVCMEQLGRLSCSCCQLVLQKNPKARLDSTVSTAHVLSFNGFCVKCCKCPHCGKHIAAWTNVFDDWKHLFQNVDGSLHIFMFYTLKMVSFINEIC